MKQIHHFGGPKVSNGHTSFTELALKISKIVLQHEPVTKISSGKIKRRCSKYRGVVMRQMSGALLLCVDDGRTRQIITIYVSDMEKAKEVIISAFEEKGIEIVHKT